MLIYILRHLFNLRTTPNIEIYEHLRNFLHCMDKISRQHRISIIKFVSKTKKKILPQSLEHLTQNKRAISINDAFVFFYI